MEHLEFKHKNRGGEATPARQYCLSGVVASGNLEVMMEYNAESEECVFLIDTAASGFRSSWQAVINDFMDRNRPYGLKVSINDNAASPAVVSLRLDQAFEALCGGE
ncbi:MAG: malonate decarboxylase acyl carrier protein [Victivallaceae bacterium]|nr:malonate decarboxylase acyl carrier protein [Victivallaceae bacterium]